MYFSRNGILLFHSNCWLFSEILLFYSLPWLNETFAFWSVLFGWRLRPFSSDVTSILRLLFFFSAPKGANSKIRLKKFSSLFSLYSWMFILVLMELFLLRSYCLFSRRTIFFCSKDEGIFLLFVSFCFVSSFSLFFLGFSVSISFPHLSHFNTLHCLQQLLISLILGLKESMIYPVSILLLLIYIFWEPKKKEKKTEMI